MGMEGGVHMRLGSNVEGYKSASEWALMHVQRGLGAAYWPLSDSAPESEIEEYLEAARSHELVIAEVGVWNNVLDPDPVKREENIAKAIARLRTAERVSARCCVNISGSRSPVWDGPHPQNLTRETFDLVVATTQRIIDAVAPKNTRYALEPMPWMYPNDTRSMLALINAVNRRAFGVHVDMVNLVNSYDKIYRTGELTSEFFMYLKPYICSVHLKDVDIDVNRLTLHIGEVQPGQGVFDVNELLMQCARLPDVPVMLEHLATQVEYDQAISFVNHKVERLGLQLKRSK